MRKHRTPLTRFARELRTESTGQHQLVEVQDATRTSYLKTQGYRVLRFWNNDVLLRTDAVLEEILRAIDDSE